MKETFNWAIIGAGRIAGKFANDLKTVPGANLLAIASRSLARADTFAQNFSAAKAFGSYEELLDCGDIDAVYVASRHIHHRDHTLLCLENGLPVLCEKPFAVNEQQVQEMLKTAADRDTFLMEAMWTRFLPTTIKILEIINNGELGKIHGVTADFGFKAAFDPQGRLFNHQLAGGSILDIGIYPIFLALLTLGMPQEIKATAHIGRTRIDEQCGIFFKYNNGAIAHLQATILSDTPCTAHIYGEKGTINIHRRWHEAQSFDISFYDGRKARFEYPRTQRGYIYEIEEVMNCVNQGKKQSDLWSFKDSQNLMKLLDSVRTEVNMKYDFE